MRHYLQMSKLHSKNNYDRKDADKQKTNEFTKTFCDQAEYQINKKVKFCRWKFLNRHYLVKFISCLF